ncbi:MAG: tyrosine-protein phosphatase, partial [Sporichthyaceae bacterium]|nr:tyrosine-protein phosphatase [Sporichthyaceae bacterium]
ACLVDFRHPHEVELTGVDRLPEPPPPRLVRLPLFNTEHDVFTAVSALITGRAGPEVADVLRDDHASGGAVVVMRELYRWFVTAPVAQQAFASALRLVAAADALPLLFHCTAGKDRTGWLAAVIQSALGVVRGAVVEDYLRTNDLNAEGTRHVLASARDRVDDPALLLPLLEARPDYLEAAFAEVDRSFGDLDGYLRAGLGLDDAELAAVRTTLLT